MSLNTVSDLQEEMRSSGGEYDSLEFDTYLRQANQQLPGLVGRTFIEHKRIEFEDETSVNLDFANLESFDKIHNTSDDTIIADTDYTENLSEGSVDFDQNYVDNNFFEGLILEFYYTPTAFKTLELKLAKELILNHETIVTGDEVTNTQVQNLRRTINNLVRRINNRNSYSIQRGDNQDRGSLRPRRTNVDD